VFENSVLRRIFGLNRVELTGGWRIRHNDDLHNLYPLSSIINDQIEEDKMGGTRSTSGGGEECIYVIV
jgi:hypothetical protein